MLRPILLGAVLGGLFVLGARAWKPSAGPRVLAIGLVVAALIYVGFALALRSDFEALLVEASGVVVFSGLAWLGLRSSLWWLAAGWGAHVAWDVGLHFDRRQAFVPSWYPLLCVGFDLIVAGYLLALLSAPRPPREMN